ncbi:mobile element protein [Rhodococcus wratislaviensis]|uniref:Mobile element protein n=1 Tax=Rhodococcus wratislaviensis TaxID=44752 RepID=A0A402C5Q9_RHOWR|nr:mobile element protein [Rhodococcus wratislaviensis]
MVNAILAVKSRQRPRCRKPGKVRADKGYDYDKHRWWLRKESIGPRIAAAASREVADSRATHP